MSLNCDYKGYLPSDIQPIKTVISQLYIVILRNDSVIFLSFTYLDLNFDVIHAGSSTRYEESNDRR